jgi:hypothetical protein
MTSKINRFKTKGRRKIAFPLPLNRIVIVGIDVPPQFVITNVIPLFVSMEEALPAFRACTWMV